MGQTSILAMEDPQIASFPEQEPPMNPFLLGLGWVSTWVLGWVSTVGAEWVTPVDWRDV